MTRSRQPYLQLVMTRLWDEEMRAGSHVLRLATLNRLGGAEQIVRTHLDATMSALSADEQDVAARVFQLLVTPSGAKIAHAVPDLADMAGSPRVIGPVLDKLSGSECAHPAPGGPAADQPQAPRYEIFHDVLARRSWIGGRVFCRHRNGPKPSSACRRSALWPKNGWSRSGNAPADCGSAWLGSRSCLLL